MGIFNKTKKADDIKQPIETTKTEPTKAETKIAKAKPLAKDGAENKKSVRGLLLSPVITEKSAKDERYGKYTFQVEGDAGKNEIKKAVETRYGIKPVKVNIITSEGKYKRYGRFWGKRKDTKKAVVTLPSGKSINVYENK